MLDELVLHWRVLATAVLLAIAVLVMGYNRISRTAHHRGHACVYNSLEQHDPLLLAMVLIALHRRRVIFLQDLDETVAWMMHRHKHYDHHSVLDDDGLGDYIRGCYQRLGKRVQHRAEDVGSWQ